MFKSVLDWIIGVEPVNRWALILMLAGHDCWNCSYAKNIGKKTLEGEK